MQKRQNLPPLKCVCDQEGDLWLSPEEREAMWASAAACLRLFCSAGEDAAPSAGDDGPPAAVPPPLPPPSAAVTPPPAAVAADRAGPAPGRSKKTSGGPPRDSRPASASSSSSSSSRRRSAPPPAPPKTTPAAAAAAAKSPALLSLEEQLMLLRDNKNARLVLPDDLHLQSAEDILGLIRDNRRLPRAPASRRRHNLLPHSSSSSPLSQSPSPSSSSLSSSSSSWAFNPASGAGAAALQRDMLDRMRHVQRTLDQISYNHMNFSLFPKVIKARPFARQAGLAKLILKLWIPIKCLEAVIVGMYLTLGIPDLDRFTISFKTESEGHVYRHIVLGVRYRNHFGAVGLSRRSDLMWREMRYESLSDLIRSFKEAYEKNWHRLLKIKLGLPVSHDATSNEEIVWKYLTLSTCSGSQMDWDEVTRLLERFGREIRSKSYSMGIIKIQQKKAAETQKSRKSNSPTREPRTSSESLASSLAMFRPNAV